jgi:hypothetical protein
MTKHGSKVDSQLGFQRGVFKFLKKLQTTILNFYNVQYVATTMYYCVFIIVSRKKNFKMQ